MLQHVSTTGRAPLTISTLGATDHDAALLLLCMGPRALPFARQQASAEREGALGDMFDQGYWGAVERDMRRRIVSSQA